VNIHEHQAKAVLGRYGLPVPRGGVAFSTADALEVARGLPGPPYVVKAQIHAGGRGKGGGVKVVRSLDEVEREAARMLGMRLVTHQTGPEGRIVHRLYVEEGAEIVRELYLSLLIDRKSSRLSVVASTAGGMDIEKVAAATPEKILTLTIDPATGYQPFHARRLCAALDLKGTLAADGASLLSGLYRVFNETDASLIEINPLVLTGAGRLLCLDAKMTFDDNALFRQPEIRALRDESEEDPIEREAAAHDLNYIKLDGNIGCLVNGAGLAMATMDIIKLYGGAPANFLDVGGGASKEKVTAAFKIILSDHHVQAILVNIFGGILRCDIIAEGVVAAARDAHLSVPLVVRLAGTNVDLGKKILSQSGLTIIPADDLADAAQKTVAALEGVR
jgi:succinyl-CoA synthetase beta subunit